MVINLEDKQYFTLPSYVTKIRLEVHGGRGGRGGSGVESGTSGQNGSRVSCILDLINNPIPSKTFYAIKGYNGNVGGWGSKTGGGGGGGGSSAVLLGDTLIIQAKGGRGGKGGDGWKNSGRGSGGAGGKGYVDGSDGSSGSYSEGGRGGQGGGYDYVFEGLENSESIVPYTSGLLLLEVLEIRPTLIKSNNKYYTYQNNEFIEVEPTIENFKNYSVNLSQLITPTNKVVLTMGGGRALEHGKLYCTKIDINKINEVTIID